MAQIIFVNGHSGAGKTTLANKLGKELNLEVIHCDDFISGKNWADIPDLIIEHIKGKTNYILEGIACGRILRRIHKENIDIRPTKYYYLTKIFKKVPNTDSLNKGISAIQKECQVILDSWGTDLSFSVDN